MLSERKHAQGGVAALCSLVFILCLGQGCPPAGNGGGDPLPGADTIRTLEVTGAAVGGTGLVRVTLVDPVSAATYVALTSSNTAVASVPDTVTVPEGSTTGEATYTGNGIGSALITATLDASLEVGRADVVPVITVSSVYGSTPMAVGANGGISVDLNESTPVPLTVNLASSNPAVLTVPATITIPAYEDWISVPFTGLAPGSTIVTASLGGTTVAATVDVVASVSLREIYMINPRLAVGATATAHIYFNVMLASDQVVNLTSSNAGVVSVPATTTVGAGYPGMFSVVAVAPGTATITASWGGASLSLPVTVVAAPSVSVALGRDRFQTGAAVSLTAGLDAVSPTDTTVNFSSSNGAVLAVPPTASIAAGQSGVSIPLTAGTPGTAIITASTAGGSSATQIFVVAAPQLRAFNIGGPSEPGIAIDVDVNLDAVPAADIVATITNSAPGVVSAPTTVVFPAGDSSASFVIQTLAPGSARLSIIIPGSGHIDTTDVVAAAGIQYIAVTTPQVGQPSLFTVTLNALPVTDKLVIVTNSNPAALGMPAFMGVLVRAGAMSGSVPVMGLAPGVGVLTATLGATTDTANYTVAP